jgi:uncharacterized membrane protein
MLNENRFLGTFRGHNTRTIMQTEINKVAEWLNVNKLSLNTNKTKFILFRSSNKKPKYDFKISINDKNIEQVKSTLSWYTY